MMRFIFNKAFQLGFWIALLSIAVFNLFTLSGNTDTRVRHYVQSVGFPFTVYEWGGNPYIERFSPFGIAADILIALVYSFLVGCFISFIWHQDLTKTGSAR